MKKLPDEKQFLDAYDELADVLFRHCYFRVSDRERARDIMQETFTRAWEYMVGGGEIQKIKSFLYRIANNLIIDYYRKRKESSLDVLREAGFDIATGEHDKWSDAIDAKAVIQTLNALDVKYRDALIMRYIDDLSPGEIAAALQETENAVSVRIHRGLEKIKKLLNNDKKL